MFVADFPRVDASSMAIHRHLSRFVRGQDTAIIELSVLFSMHIRWFKRRDPSHPSPNGLLFGPTGVGKTYAIRKAAEYLELPYVIVDTTSLVPAGIVGLQLEDVVKELVDAAGARIAATPGLSRLLRGGTTAEQAPVNPNRTSVSSTSSQALRPFENAVQGALRTGRTFLQKTTDSAANTGLPTVARDWVRPDSAKIALAERGIVFFDEFDKIAVARGLSQADSGELASRVQRRLLKFVEGSQIRIGVKEHTSDASPDRWLDTTGVLCVASGAFEGLHKLTPKRDHKLSLHLVDPTKLMSQDIVTFGFIPELVARLPILVEYKGLTRDILLEILSDEDEGPLRVWLNYYESIDASLHVPQEAKDAVADYASALGMGARGLPQVLFPVLARRTFEMERARKRSLRLSAIDFRAKPGY